ncbi:ACP synthase [Candidatus Pacearchaeota archaeon CG10_big_fil_rev_8_21_14_0_10_32_42]|nr:MAG: ACP synthase [Candidatus Pacearchaeota archaeon CG10_big_fil_rev_8_21_14_0_10_32_42]
MKALSLKQPFAELVVSGKKTIELRKWKTNFRGQFFVHASKIPDEKSMKKLGFQNLPTGVIVGTAKLIDVKEYKNESEYQKDRNKHLANSSWGKYGFILKNFKRIKPIPAKGKLNFWESGIKLKN